MTGGSLQDNALAKENQVVVKEEEEGDGIVNDKEIVKEEDGDKVNDEENREDINDILKQNINEENI